MDEEQKPPPFTPKEWVGWPWWVKLLHAVACFIALVLLKVWVAKPIANFFFPIH